MRKVVLQEFVSIDGFVAGPNGSVDFIPASAQRDPSLGREQVALMDTIDMLLLGRVTYGMVAGFWPNVTEGPENEFADHFNAVPKLVFSKTLMKTVKQASMTRLRRRDSPGSAPGFWVETCSDRSGVRGRMTAGRAGGVTSRLNSLGAHAMRAKPETIDEYLAPLTDETRAALEKLRTAIRSAAPKAEECISYQVPAFRLGGRMLVAFGAGAHHCAFYPGAFPVATHKDELRAYDTSKGTIRFQPDCPLPASLVRKLVKTRIAEQAAQRRPAADRAMRRRSTRDR